VTTSRWSLAARLTGWYAGTAFLLVAGAAVLQYRGLVGTLLSEDDKLLREGLAAAQTGIVGLSFTDMERIMGLVVRRLDSACRVTGPDVAVPPPSCDRTQGLAFRSWRAPDGTLWRTVFAPVGDESAAWIEVLLDRSGDEYVLRAYRQRLFVVLALALALGCLFGYGVARSGLRPLTILGERIGKIDARSLDQRVGREGLPVEITTLAKSCDGMLERLEVAFRALAEVSADLAHEIRTPLHLLRQQAEVALTRTRTPEEYREVLGSSLEELDRLRRMTDDMLFLAYTENPRAVIERRPLSIGTELREVAEYLDAMASEGQIVLDTDAPAELGLNADRTLLRRVLVNVLTNALRHTPPGGRVSLRSWQDNAAVVIAVQDTGEGIPSDLLPRVLDRHFRVPSTRSARSEGSGLGLAIVRGIMQLHGGAVSIASSQREGTRVTLTFPN
jgi:two-component system heavy metal sensor histidine kinase CusS